MVHLSQQDYGRCHFMYLGMYVERMLMTTLSWCTRYARGSCDRKGTKCLVTNMCDQLVLTTTNRYYKLRRHFEPHPRLDYFVKQLHNITQISWQQRRSFEVPEFQKSHRVNLALVWGPEARLVVLQHALFSQHITYLTAPICCATC